MRNPCNIARLLVVLLLPAGLISAGGCSRKIWIVQYPAFYSSKLKTVAVVPFRNQSTGKNAGNIVSGKLASALAANGAYKVFNRNDLKTLMDESDLQIALGTDTSDAAGKFRKLTDVQAIVTGAVTTYSATSNNQRRQDPIYATDRRGNSYIQGYRTYVYTRNEANVSVTASLIRVRDGTGIYATPAPASARVGSEGSPPRKDPYACITEAADVVVGQLLEQLAPIRKQVKVDPSKALRTASELYDNKWAFTDTFEAGDQKMYVVVSLPACCDRNRFRLVIVSKDQRRELARQDIVWSREHAGFGYVFSPKDIAAGAGPGVYEVKLYSGPEPVLRHTFKIR